MTTLKDIQISTTLGKGTYSDVYKVQRILGGAIHAIKVLRMNTLFEKEEV